MGTRSLTFFYEEKEEKPSVCMYRQFDGYPSGHGLELAEFLTAHKLCNGFGTETMATHANGMGCLAAQAVAHFKTELGGIYLYAPDTKDAWQDYEYHVYSDKVIVKNAKRKEIFDGSWKSFKNWCEENMDN